MRIFLTLIFLALLPPGLLAQVPGTRLTIDASVTSITLRGDTTHVAYVLSSRPESQDSLFAFIVDAPAHVTSITPPNSLWVVDSLVRGTQPAAFWGILNPLPPGATSPAIAFESVGIPGIMTSWAQGNWPLPTCCDDDPPSSGEDPIVTRSVSVSVVGVEPWPSDRSAQSLLARLRTLTQTSCASPLSWITDAALCSQLVSDIDAAESYRASGQNAQAQSSLDHYSGLISSPDPGVPATGVKNAAYWLLNSNIQVVKSSL
jgi:hypothetical protein